MILKMTAPNCELIIDLNYGRGKFMGGTRTDQKNPVYGRTHHAGPSGHADLCPLWTGIKVDPEEFLKALDE